MEAVLIGILSGIIAGIVPGMHHNLLTQILVAQNISNVFIAVSIMIIVSLFFNVLRSFFLMIPSESHVLAMHPIYRYVNSGKALIGIKLVSFGILISIFFSIIISPLIIIILPFLYAYAEKYIPFILGLTISYLILKERNPFFALLIFILSGILGYFGLRILSQPLVILLSGFFGLSILLQQKSKIERQLKSDKLRIRKKAIFRGILSSFFASFFAIFLPGVGPAQASILTRGFLKNDEEFLISIGGLSGFTITFSSFLLYTIGKTRVGSLKIISNLIDFEIVKFFAILLTFGIFSYLLIKFLAKKFITIFQKFDYNYIKIFSMFLLMFFSFYFDNVLGVLFLLIATSIGVLANKLKVRMSNCMGSLILPMLIQFII